MPATGERKLRVGIAGLGIASMRIAEEFRADSPYELVAGADIRADARAAFEKRFQRDAVDSVEALCRRADVDAVWVSTPNPLHAEHTVCAARHGKHIVCEKPMAVSLAECDRMIRAAEENGVLLLQGHSKIYNAPVRMMGEIVQSGRLGRLLQIQTGNFNDWLQRIRVAIELDTAQGGGLVYRQGPHMVDIVRFIGGGMVADVRGIAGRADPHFDTEGHFSALLAFDTGAAATLSFNGYGYFDGTELTWDIGEGGRPADRRHFPRKPRLTGPIEAAEKFSSAEERVKPEAERAKPRQPFFGLTIVTCERGAIRQSPDGIFVYTEDGREEIACTERSRHNPELLELVDALSAGRPAFPDGRWGKATLEVCLAILDSSRDGKLRQLHHQIPVPPQAAIAQRKAEAAV
jgi:phthalate 4,5-cis-dihydrodiol dehydrogenase